MFEFQRKEYFQKFSDKLHIIDFDSKQPWLDWILTHVAHKIKIIQTVDQIYPGSGKGRKSNVVNYTCQFFFKWKFS